MDAIKRLVAQSQRMAGAKDGWVAALRGIAAAGGLASVADIGDAVMRSASLGVSYGTKGFGVSGAMSRAKGHANVDVETRNNTHITATDKVIIQSGGDTNIAGAVVKGSRVEGNIGGDLNIASTQDTMESEAEQKSSGGGFDISQGGGSAGGSYAGVREQSGYRRAPRALISTSKATRI